MLTATASRFLNRITIQSKKLDFDGIPQETLEIEVPSDEPLTLQEVRQAFWEKRWTHCVVSHNMIDLFNPNYEF